MGLIWWIVPALTGVIGLMLTFAGLGRLMKLRMAAGGLRFLFGIGFLGLAGVGTFAGLNLQTYQRLTYERPVAKITFSSAGGTADAFRANIQLAEGDQVTCFVDGGTEEDCVLTGDEFSMGAQVITYKPMATIVGYDSVYRLEYVEGRMSRRYNTATVTEATSNGLALSKNPGLDVYTLAKQQGNKMGMETQFGSAVYAPMGDGLSYDVVMTQDALKLEPGNAAARQAMSLRD
ncbi:hypothetical protein [Henriciella pelagia]|jgi:hypothetical protein|uniref:Uncharacterized protein n=1 Tax=Henriciella pelagia TaxID=1977912 RepID=A0ABQ1JXC0_9PROT|nr:hypothetical protein [Henriciella pelagia]GGB77514.1 hypothetical protein GCM10011503_27860 [Henriciella pelagia]